MSSKIDGVLQRSEQLLQDKQFYEYSQKMKALANRYNSTGKVNDAQNLLIGSTKNMLKHGEIMEAFDLVTLCIELSEKQYENQPIPSELKQNFIEVYQMYPESKQKIQVINKVLKTFFKQGDQEIFRIVGTDLMSKNEFSLAQKFLLHLNDAQLSVQFLQQWTKVVSEIEADYIIFRFCILKLTTEKLDEVEQIHKQINSKTPLANCLGLVIKAAKINSETVYTTTLNLYSPILHKDASFQKILKKVGVKYFGFPEEKQQGLLNMIFSN